MRQPSKRLKMSFDEEEFVGSDNVEQRGLFQERKVDCNAFIMSSISLSPIGYFVESMFGFQETIPGAYSMSCVPNLVTDGLNVEDSDSEDEE